MRIEIIAEPITRAEAMEIAKEIYGNMVKGAVDVEREILALGGEYHMDANTALLESGSRQENVWGFNIHLERPREDWIAFTSLINIRPAQGNRQMKIEDTTLCVKIADIINRKIV